MKNIRFVCGVWLISGLLYDFCHLLRGQEITSGEIMIDLVAGISFIISVMFTFDVKKKQDESV